MAKKEKLVDWNALAQAFDNTWARASTEKGSSYSDKDDRTPLEWRIDSRSVSMSKSEWAIKVKLISNEQILLTYLTTFVYTNNNEKMRQKKLWEEEADARLKEAVKRIKEEYKKQAEQSLSMKEDKSDITIEDMSSTIHGKRNTAIFRKHILFDLE